MNVVEYSIWWVWEVLVNKSNKDGDQEYSKQLLCHQIILVGSDCAASYGLHHVVPTCSSIHMSSRSKIVSYTVYYRLDLASLQAS